MGVGRLVSTKNLSFSGSMFIYHRVIHCGNQALDQRCGWITVDHCSFSIFQILTKKLLLHLCIFMLGTKLEGKWMVGGSTFNSL